MDHHHAHDEHHHEEPMSQEEIIQHLLVLGQVALDAQDYESAVDAYASALKIGPDATAFSNLGSLYARGLGVKRDFVEAGRLFHQAELMGNELAGKLCGKCMFDFVCQGIAIRKPADLYAAMSVFASMVYPEATDQKQEVNNGLYAIASTLLNKGEQAAAEKVFRAAAEFGGDEYARSYLDLLEQRDDGDSR